MPGRACAGRAVVATAAHAVPQRAGKKRGLSFMSKPLTNTNTAVEDGAPGGGGAYVEKKQKPVARFCGCIRCLFKVLNSITVQTVLYITFVAIFQTLLDSLRMKEEYFLDKYISDTFIENHFDSSHNTLESVRRVADIWEWGNNVLWPGLLGNLGPCGDEVGAEQLYGPARGDYRPRYDADGLRAAMGIKGCNDDVWPDGEGSFHLRNATAWTVAEMVKGMDAFDWTSGISIRQVRVTPSTKNCVALGPECYPEMASTGIQKTPEKSDMEPFGYNWTTQGRTPLDNPWVYMTSEQLGSDPKGQNSANLASFRPFESGGFVAVVIPFFSTEYLPDEQGNSSEVTDFREYYVNTTNARIAQFICVRLSWNGKHIQQLCDPNEPVYWNGTAATSPVPGGRTTGVVRAAIEEFWNDMKRAHFIDFQTRLIHITMDATSNNIGIRSRCSMMYEITSIGSVLPSYDFETRVQAVANLDVTRLYMDIAFAMCITFMVLELVEMQDSGPYAYFTDMWNLMDWLNYGIFCAVWVTLKEAFRLEPTTNAVDAPDCTDPSDGGSELCAQIGFKDAWDLMRTVKTAKLYLSVCVCIQLLKVIKFMNQVVPKTSLAVEVLSKGLLDLAFFGLVFIISLFAFSEMFFVQLGSVMENYNDQYASAISLARALFGDFDIDEIMNNSPDYLNAIFFISYLFVAIFIMLSIFLTILGESQGKVREMESDAKRRGDVIKNEFGIFHTMGLWLRDGRLYVAAKGKQLRSYTASKSSAYRHAEAACRNAAEAVGIDMDESAPEAAPSAVEEFDPQVVMITMAAQIAAINERLNSCGGGGTPDWGRAAAPAAARAPAPAEAGVGVIGGEALSTLDALNSGVAALRAELAAMRAENGARAAASRASPPEPPDVFVEASLKKKNMRV